LDIKILLKDAVIRQSGNYQGVASNWSMFFNDEWEM